MLDGLRHLAYRVLRRGERYTGTDNVYLAKSGFWLSAASAIASIASFALSLLFARLVDKHDYGAYQYAISWGSILSMASLTGVSTALMSAVAQGKSGTVRPVVRTRARWSLIGGAVALAGGAYYAAKGRPDLAAAVAILGVAMPLQTALLSWADYVVAHKRFELQTAFASLDVIVAAGALVAVMFLAPSAPALAAAYAVAHLGIAAFAYRSVLKKLPPNDLADPTAVPYGKKLSLLDAFSTVAAYVDRIVVFTFLGAAETAIYVFATAPAEQIKGQLKNIYFLAFPKIAAKPIEEMRPSFFRKCLVMTGVVGAIALAYALVAPLLYPILFPAYHESIRLTQLYALSLPATVAVLPLALFNGHKLVKESATYQVASSVVGIALLFVLTWRFGLVGTVLARVIGRYVGVLISMLLAARVFSRPSPAAPPSRSPGSGAPASA